MMAFRTTSRPIDISQLEIGDKVMLDINKYGVHRLTTQTVNQETVTLLFDDCVSVDYMTDDFGLPWPYHGTYLNHWIDDVFKPNIPAVIRERILLIGIPSVQQIVGVNDRPDFLPMLTPRNRITLFNNRPSDYWLCDKRFKKPARRNINELPVVYAYVTAYGDVRYGFSGTKKRGVRPYILLRKDKG